MTRRDPRTLPKAELHLHLLAAMRPATLVELAAEDGRSAPDPRGFTDFPGFQRVFNAAFEATSARPENLARVVAELVEDVAADGAVWVQPHFDPHSYDHFGSGEQVLELVLDAGRQSAGLTAAPHAGELCGPDSVRDAVEHLGATRVAHGIRAAEDPTLLELLVERGVSLDVCLSSNRVLGVVGDLSEHPLPQLLAAGVGCSLGTDDPLMFGSSLAEEYLLARDTFGLTDRQLAAMAWTSVQTGDAPAEVVAAAVAGIDAWLGPTPGPGAPRSPAEGAGAVGAGGER